MEFTLKSFWDTHFNVALVRWVAAFAGNPDAGGTKADVVQWLVSSRIMPAHTRHILQLIEDWKASQAGTGAAVLTNDVGPGVGGAVDTGHGGLQAGQMNDGLGAAANPITASDSVQALGDRVAHLEALLLIADAKKSDDAAAFARVLASVTGDNALRPQPIEDQDMGLTRMKFEDTVRYVNIWGIPAGSMSKGAQLTVLQRHLAKEGRNLSSKLFVNPMAVCARYLEKLKFDHRTSTSVPLSYGIKLVSNELPDKLSGKSCVPDDVRDGLYMIVEASVRCGLHERAAGLASFSRYIWGFSEASELGRANFIKHFLFAHTHEVDLVPLVNDDPAMVRRFLSWHPDTSSRPSQSLSSMNRARGKGVKRARPSQPPGPGRSHGVPPRARKICFSRADASVGECKYHHCRFDHKCATCGQDHSAARCPKWDAAKGRASAEANKQL